MSNNIQTSRDFKGIWIEKNIWIHPELSALEKILWAEIDSLFDANRDGCYASNQYLAKFCGVAIRQLQKMIAHLKSLSLIKEIYFNGRVRVMKAIAYCTPAMHRSAPLPCKDLPCTKVHVCHALKCTAALETNLESGRDKIITKKKEINKDATTPTASPLPSAEASELSLFFRDCIKERKPDFKKPNLNNWAPELDRMIKIDKRGVSRAKELIKWSGMHSFWSANILSPKSLRNNFDKLDIQQKSESQRSPQIENMQSYFKYTYDWMCKKNCKNNVNLGHNYIEFLVSDRVVEYIKCDDPSAKDRIKNFLRKLMLID